MKKREFTYFKTLVAVAMVTGISGFSAQGVADPIQFPPRHLADTFTETVDTVTVSNERSVHSFYELFYVIATGDKKDIPDQIPEVEFAPWKAKGLAAIWSHSRGPRHEQMLQREYEQLHKKLGS